MDDGGELIKWEPEGIADEVGRVEPGLGVAEVGLVIEGVFAGGLEGADGLRSWGHLAGAGAEEAGDDVAGEGQGAGEVEQVVLGQPFEPGFVVVG